jgi:hypothetical protein
MNKKSIFPIAGVLGLALALVVLAGCPTEADDNPFVGTWSGGNESMSYILIIDGSNWTMQVKIGTADPVNVKKGTYTYNGNTANCVDTHEWDSDDGDWEEVDEADPFEAVLDGNTLTVNAMTLTKQ